MNCDIASIIESIRRHQMSTGEKWPGRRDLREPPYTLYPNLAAELEASGYFLWCPADRAGITEELLADVLEAGKDLHLSEMLGLCRLLQCSADYLYWPKEVQTVDPSTNRGKRRVYLLQQAMERFVSDFGLIARVKEYPCGFNLWKSQRLLYGLENGETVTFARYRKAMADIEDAREYLSRSKPRGRV